MKKVNVYSEKIKRFYGSDPRELPLYGLRETANYLKVNVATLKSWIKGRTYKLEDGTERFWAPVIKLPQGSTQKLSFLNLIEIHVLLGIRRIHNVQFRKVRESLKYLEAVYPEKNNPLATEQFWTDSFDLFIKEAGGLICTSQRGQYVIEAAIKQYLHRIDRDVDLQPFRLFPFASEIVLEAKDEIVSTQILEAQPKTIVIDPLIAFGRPTIFGTGIPTNVIAGRFAAGQRQKSLALDYGIEEEQVKEALIYEGALPKAA
ncbi:MAG: DUF433 domain-containing protein [Acidobacteria bacterium]|nr:DUF433 domain-containing protein [Acidobacteriota bacterium]